MTYYDDLGDGEWERLTGSLHGELEFENTVAYLERHLPDEGRVLDAGGGAGRYAAWLLERGYDVALLDPSPGQLAVARDRVVEPDAGGRLDLLRGSVHRLPVGDDAFDATLCLGGPLSHLTAERRRAAAASELARVTAPSGPASVAAETGSLDDVSEREAAAVRETVEALREDPTVADLSTHVLAVCEA